jgi:hypothetical protein
VTDGDAFALPEMSSSQFRSTEANALSAAVLEKEVVLVRIEQARRYLREKLIDPFSEGGPRNADLHAWVDLGAERAAALTPDLVKQMQELGYEFAKLQGQANRFIRIAPRDEDLDDARTA